MADTIDLLTAALRTEFVNNFTAVAKPAKIEEAVLRVPSTARQENYPWLGPVPGVAEYRGFRRWAKIANIKYQLANLEYSTEIEINTVDVDDDQTGGFARKGRELSEKMKLWPNRLTLKNLGQAAVSPAAPPGPYQLTPPASAMCFDGTPMFGVTHAFGTAGTAAFPTGNMVTFQCANPQGNSRIVALVKTGDIKPLIWQERETAKFQTDSGTPQSSQAKVVRYWVDGRGAPGFTYWWHSTLAVISGTPTIQEMQQIFGLISAQFRSYALPISLATDTPEYIHEQVEFNKDNLLLIVSAGIEHIVRQALTLTLISTTENVWVGWADYVATNFLN